MYPAKRKKLDEGGNDEGQATDRIAGGEWSNRASGSDRPGGAEQRLPLPGYTQYEQSHYQTNQHHQRQDLYHTATSHQTLQDVQQSKPLDLSVKQSAHTTTQTVGHTPLLQDNRAQSESDTQSQLDNDFPTVSRHLESSFYENQTLPHRNKTVLHSGDKEYEVWYRDDSQPDIKNISDRPNYSKRTLDELLTATEGHTVTHMAIKGDIPPLQQIAPDLKQLVLGNITDVDQLEIITSLPKLEVLKLSCNRRLRTLPSSIGELKSLTNLVIVGCDITEIPESITSLPKLEVLKLYNIHGLRTLPSSIGELKSLTNLAIVGCDITEIPESITSLPKLEVLELSSNIGLHTLPSSIGELKSLTNLVIDYCDITEILESITSLPKLEVLELFCNRGLHTLLSSIGELKSLTNLVIDNCEITEIPESITSLPKLEVLELSNNIGLHTLPSSIGELKSLTNLVINFCGITEIPESITSLPKLEVLELSWNTGLHTLPSSIGELKSLTNLAIVGCDITEIPESITSLPKLEVLELSYIGLHTLPSSIGELKSLTNLVIDCCGITEIPESITSLPKLEVLKLSNIHGLRTLPSSIGELKSLTNLVIVGCDITEIPESIGALTNLEKLLLSGNGSLSTLPDEIGDLKNLKKLDLRECNLTGIPDSIGSLTNLEEIDLCMNKSLHTLPSRIGDLKNVKKLDLHHCDLTEIPESIGALTNLEELLLNENRSLSTLPDEIGDLKNLKKLDLRECNLTGIPDSIGSLTNLEEIDLCMNKSLHTLPSRIGDLKNVKKLDLHHCDLTEIPESIGALTNLEELLLNENRSLSTLPDEIGDLKNLKKLDLRECNLTGIPDSIGSLTNLEEIDLCMNKSLHTLPSRIGDLKNVKKLDLHHCDLTEIPESISELSGLRALDVSENKSLKRLPASIGKLCKLQSLSTTSCISMTFPPSAVRKQGLKAVLKYLDDNDKCGHRSFQFIPVTVIGESMAGKTSLVKTMQGDKRSLTKRSGVNKLDEATKVFKVSEAKTNENSTLVFHDFGGQVIYHFTYPLSSRYQFVPMLVINIAEFDSLVNMNGVEAACEKLCFDWLSHLYISCPQAGPPLLVLTHRDMMKSAKVFRERKRQLIEATETLRLRIIREEKTMAPESSSFFSMTSFCDTAKPLLTVHKPMVVYKGSGKSAVANLKSALHMIGLSILTELPENWYIFMNLCAGKTDKPYLTLVELELWFPEDKDHIVLQYLHEIGKVMWYKERDKLANIVFHRIDLLTKLVELLFDHSSQEAWDQRLKNFIQYKHDGQGIGKRKYENMVDKFQTTGVMNSILLSNLIDSESVLDPEVATEVLKVFHLICGPISEGSETHYIIPYFSKKVISVLEIEGYIPMKVEICFDGLPLPTYVYHLLTAIFVDLNITPLNHIEVGMNGACIMENDGTVKYLFHSHSERNVTILTLTNSKDIANSWTSQLSNLRHLTEKLKAVWKGAHFETVFYCSHCLLTKQLHPTIEVDPDWDDILKKPYTGAELCKCTKDIANKGLSIPFPLLNPCGSIIKSGIQTLDRSLLEYQRSQQSLTCSSSLPGAAVPPAELEEIMAIINSDTALINLEPVTVDGAAPTSTKKGVNPMSETRGRALIISNSYNNTRQGSEHDYANMKRMLEKLGYITVGGHRSYQAHEVITEIHKETQLVDDQTREYVHRHLRSFILVITSHGDQGVVGGSDGKQIEITEIMDLLSPKNFPAMEKKPKIVIIQACAGSKREMLRTDWHAQAAANQNQPGGDQRVPDDYTTDSTAHDISTSDFIIMQSSFDSFVSPRSPVVGSPYIRALVAVFYKYAHRLHVEELADIIRLIVAKIGVQNTEYLLGTRRYRGNPQEAHVASMPQTRCTFLGYKFYLRPLRIDNHPNRLRNPVLPNPTTTRIEQQPDHEQSTRDSNGLAVGLPKIFYKWLVRRNV